MAAVRRKREKEELRAYFRPEMLVWVRMRQTDSWYPAVVVDSDTLTTNDGHCNSVPLSPNAICRVVFFDQKKTKFSIEVMRPSQILPYFKYRDELTEMAKGRKTILSGIEKANQYDAEWEEVAKMEDGTWKEPNGLKLHNKKRQKPKAKAKPTEDKRPPKTAPKPAPRNVKPVIRRTHTTLEADRPAAAPQQSVGPPAQNQRSPPRQISLSPPAAMHVLLPNAAVMIGRPPLAQNTMDDTVAYVLHPHHELQAADSKVGILTDSFEANKVIMGSQALFCVNIQDAAKYSIPDRIRTLLRNSKVIMGRFRNETAARNGLERLKFVANKDNRTYAGTTFIETTPSLTGTAQALQREYMASLRILFLAPNYL